MFDHLDGIAWHQIEAVGIALVLAGFGIWGLTVRHALSGRVRPKIVGTIIRRGRTELHYDYSSAGPEHYLVNTRQHVTNVCVIKSGRGDK